VNSSGALWKIPIENSIGDSLCNWHDEQCSQFTNEFIDGIYSIGNFVCKNDTSSFFFALFYFFSHCNSLGIYRENISVGKIPRKFTDGNIPSVFPFVFIDFLIVACWIIVIGLRVLLIMYYVIQEILVGAVLDVYVKSVKIKNFLIQML
jgi:hypothetical protein